jgi:hypothetical protein
MDFTLLQLDGYIIIGDDTGKTFGDIEHLNCVWSIHDRFPPALSSSSIIKKKTGR